MEEELRLINYYAAKAQMIGDNFVMAINGAFFTTRRSNIPPTSAQLENAKSHVTNAFHLFITNFNDLLEQINNLFSQYEFPVEIELIQAQIVTIGLELLKQAIKAVSTGIQNKAVNLLGKNNAHGSFGLLVNQIMGVVELTATDTAGRKWKDPSSLLRVIIRGYVYGNYVDLLIKDFQHRGIDLINVPNVLTPVSIQGTEGYINFNEVKNTLHPNSSHLPTEWKDET